MLRKRPTQIEVNLTLPFDLARRGDAVVDLQRAMSGHAAKLAHQTLASPDERVGSQVLKLLDAMTVIVEAAFAPPQPSLLLRR